MGFYIFAYLCIGVFILATGRLIYRQIRFPLHVRFEIYPVRHETTVRVAYGGSYMEEVNWWDNPYETSRWNELQYMIPEILLLRGLWKTNRSLWWASFPFHFGLYLMVAALGLLLLNACFALLGFSASADGSVWRSLLDCFIVAAGWIGLILGSAGGLALLAKRFLDREWREYSSFADYFHLIVILTFFLSATTTALFVDPGFTGAKAFVYGLLTAGRTLDAGMPSRSACGAMAIVSASFLIAYIPLTHMSHMFMKYFLYHNVKWDDVPNRRGGRSKPPSGRILSENRPGRPGTSKRTDESRGKTLLLWLRRSQNDKCPEALRHRAAV